MSEASTNRYSIAIGLDGSESSWKAFKEALAQARLKEAILHIVSVQESVEASFSASEVLAKEKTAHDYLEKLQIKARLEAERDSIVSEMQIVSGNSEAALVEYVKKNNVNLLVVGDTGHSSIWGALLGNTAEKIVRTAPCSVLIVR